MPDDPWVLAPPNIRSMLVPDPGWCLVEADLSGADAQVVAWDAGSETLKRLLRANADLHTANAYHLYGRQCPPPRSSVHINGMTFRDNAKRAVHLTNYAGGYRTLAQSCSVTEARATDFIRWWSRVEHPAIAEWHDRVETQLRSRKMPAIRNAFGFRRIYTDRPDRLLGQALAWIAQSTVAIVINRAMLQLDCNADLLHRPRCGTCLACQQPGTIQLMLQVHDSVLLQVRSDLCPALFPEIISCCAVTVPYDDPLIIPVELKWSASDWGSMEKWQ